MRDPVTKLAIVDGSSVDPDICKAFADVFSVPDKLAIVHFVSHVTKKSRTGIFNDKRVLIVSDQCLYFCKDDGARKRSIRIRDIAEVYCFTDGFLALRVPAEYDVVFKLANTAEVDYLLNIMRVIADVCYGRTLGIVGQNGAYKSHPNVVLDRPVNYLPQHVPFTFLTADEAADGALDELLRPPPPAAPARPSDNPALAAQHPSSEAAMVLKHPLLDPHALSEVPPGLMASIASTRAARGGAGSPAKAGSPVTAGQQHQYDAVAGELQRLAALHSQIEHDRSLLEQEKHRVHVAKDMRDGGAAWPSPAPADHPSPVGSSPAMTPRALDASPRPPSLAPAATTTSPRWNLTARPRLNDSPQPAASLARTADQEQSKEALERERALEAQVAVLQAELNAQKSQAEKDAVMRRLQEDSARPLKMEPVAGPATPTPASSARPPGVGAAMPHRSTTTTPTAAPERPRETAMAFEKSIGTRPLKERLVLRQFQIDQRRADIQKLFASHGYDPLAVAELQDDLVALVHALESDLADLDAAAAASRTSSRHPSPPPPPPKAPAETMDEAVGTADASPLDASAIGVSEPNASGAAAPAGMPHQGGAAANQSGWEWTPERTAEYWNWVATQYGRPQSPQARDGPARHGDPTADRVRPPQRGGQPGSRGNTPPSRHRAPGAFAAPTVSSARHSRRTVRAQ